VVKLYRETEFKETEIGRIPADWKVTGIDSVAIECKTGIPVKEQDRVKGSYPYFGANGIIDWVNDYIFDGEYVIVAQDGSIGAIHYYIGKFWANNHVWVLRCDPDKIHHRFLFYVLKTVPWEHIATGSTRPKVTKQILLSIKIPLPPLEEQKLIARILYSVDEAIQAVDASIAKWERLKKGLMQELLTKGIGHEEFKETEIGRIPVEWEVVELKNVVAECKTGIPVKQQDRIPGPYPYFGANGIIDYVHDYIFEGEYVIVAQDGSIGAIHYFNGRFWANNHVWMVKVSSLVITKFLYYALKKLDWEKIATGSTRPKITKQTLLRVKIPLPPLDEQKRIARILSSVDTVLEEKKRKKMKLERVKKALMNLLLTGKIRVRSD